MKGLIAAGGHATRLRPITHTVNKHLIPLANKPLIEYAIEKMVEVGITDIAVNINPGDREMPKLLGDGTRWGARITCLEQQGGPKGLAHTVMNAKDWIGHESFVYYLGDNIVLGSLQPLVDRFHRENLDCLLSLARVSDPRQFGVPEIVDGRIVRVVEKPSDPPSSFAVTGIYVYSPHIFEAAEHLQPSARGEYEISDAHTALIEAGRRVGYEEVTGWWKDTGRPEDMLEGNALLLAQMKNPQVSADAVVEQGARVEGPVSIGAGSRISAGCVIWGPVAIGEQCVLTDATVGPNVSIDNGGTLTNATVENTIIMERSSVQGPCRIAHSIIARHARITVDPSAPSPSMRCLLGDHGVIEW
jgi:glucose-1-phosphate thymidylyltransferase